MLEKLLYVPNPAGGNRTHSCHYDAGFTVPPSSLEVYNRINSTRLKAPYGIDRFELSKNNLI